MIPAYTDNIADLPKRHQNAYEKRRYDNIIKYRLSEKSADLEARQFIGKALYLEQSRKEAQESQLPMFADAKLPRARTF